MDIYFLTLLLLLLLLLLPIISISVYIYRRWGEKGLFLLQLYVRACVGTRVVQLRIMCNRIVFSGSFFPLDCVCTASFYRPARPENRPSLYPGVNRVPPVMTRAFHRVTTTQRLKNPRPKPKT